MDPQVAKEGHFGQVVEAAYALSSWVSVSSAVRAHGQLSWSAGGPPKWPATRMARDADDDMPEPPRDRRDRLPEVLPRRSAP